MIKHQGATQTLISRFYHLIDRKLEQMEHSMNSDEELSAMDQERETRALGNLIRNFEKVFGMEEEVRSRNASDGAKNDECDQDAEAIRRELAERLSRLRDGKAPERK